MQKSYKAYNGTDLTFERVKFILNQGNYIEAIKTYRSITGAMLKEAKDAIDQNCANRNEGGQMHIEYNRAVNFFAQFFKPDTKGLLKALECAIDNWETLGFDSPVKACEKVLINFGASIHAPCSC